MDEEAIEEAYDSLRLRYVCAGLCWVMSKWARLSWLMLDPELVLVREADFKPLIGFAIALPFSVA